MNLNYPVVEVANWMNAKIIGNSTGVVKQVSFDSRSPLINSNTLFFAIKGEHSHGHHYITDFIRKGGKMVVVEKALPEHDIVQLLVRDSVEALQLLAMHHRQNFNIPVIAITGSNGKTTVKEWLYHVLKPQFSVIRSPKSYNSQIGVPISVLEINSHHQIAIIEAGISMPGEMERLEAIIRPTIGIYTGIGKAHEINFNSIKQKETEKLKLFKNVDLLISDAKIDKHIIKHIPFNDKASVFNASLVSETAIYIGLDPAVLKQQLANLPHISMRMEKMEGVDGNTLINDTYTFDEKGLEIALQSLSTFPKTQNKVLILAPDYHYQPTESFIDIINASSVDTLIWIAEKIVNIDQSKALIHYPSVNDFIQQPQPFLNSVLLFAGSRTMQLERCIPIYQLKKHVTQLEINLASVKNNLNFYRRKIKPETKILAMVKAQSYGGGSVQMAKFLASERIDALGVAYADEGVALRNEGIDLPILVMNPEFVAFDDIIDHNLEASIYSLKILDQFVSQIIMKGKKRIPIHLKLDTGMHRLGFQLADIKELIEMLNAQPEVYVKAVFSHLAVAENPLENEYTLKQIDLFERMSKEIEEGIGYRFSKHISNTEAISNYPLANFDMVRIGIGLFGLSSSDRSEQENALTFKTQISQIKTIEIGESVGYGRLFIASRKTAVGIVPVGYADGLSRRLGNGNWHLKVNGSFAPIIGSVCMDMCMIDLTDIVSTEGDTVEVFGWENSINEMAEKLNTIPYEIISTISSRVHRIYVQ